MLEQNRCHCKGEGTRIGIQLIYQQKCCFWGIWYPPQWSGTGVEEPANIRTILPNSASELVTVSSR